MSPYQYEGILQPQNNSNRFVTPLFSNPDLPGLYIQKGEAGRIREFKALEVTSEIRKKGRDISAVPGDKMIYSFVTDEEIVHTGTREEMEEPLLALLYSGELNVHAQLLIAAFLKLYGRSVDLLDETNRDLSNKGISTLPGTDIIFNQASQEKETPAGFAEYILEKFKKFSALSDRIRPDDILFIKDTIAYIGNRKCSIENVFNRKTMANELLNSIISSSFNSCSRRNSFNLQDMLQAGHAVYDYLLHGQNIFLEQSKIEKLLSTKPVTEETGLQTSSLEIGLRVDKEIYGNPKKLVPGMRPSEENEKSLDKSIKLIIRFAETLM